MNFTYAHPLQISMGPKPTSVAKVKDGVTEISLSDGRLIRISLHIDGVMEHSDKLDVNYSAIVEVLPSPANPILDIHESVQ